MYDDPGYDAMKRVFIRSLSCRLQVVIHFIDNHSHIGAGLPLSPQEFLVLYVTVANTDQLQG